MSSYSDFAEKLLITVYQETEATGKPFQKVGYLIKKYDIPYKPLWISQVAEEWENSYFSSISRVLSSYEDWSFRISAQGIRKIEQQYGDKDGVGQIIAPASTDHDSQNNAPASDRLVRFSDNQPAVGSARNAVAKLAAALGQANDIGNFSAVEVEEARREVWLLEQVIKQESVRVDWIASVAKTCLKWIVAKAAEQVVGTLAMAALVALAALFGFSI